MVKKYVTLLIFLLLSIVSHCQIVDNGKFNQNQCGDSLSMFGEPEELPIFDKKFPEKSTEKLREFVLENLRYPETAQVDKIDGQVYVEFWVDTIGNTFEHKIVKSVRKDLDDEILRVAKLIKFDLPAMNNGKPIGICYGFPITFSLSEKVKPSRKLNFSFGQRQNFETNDDFLITSISDAPVFKGGVDSLKTFIFKNLKYPKSALKDSIVGAVYVSFWIDVDGKTTEHEIIKGVREDVDKEALRIAHLISFESPAMQRGKPVRVKYTIPVIFNYRCTITPRSAVHE